LSRKATKSDDELYVGLDYEGFNAEKEKKKKGRGRKKASRGRVEKDVLGGKSFGD
jgi:hypothetical protein